MRSRPASNERSCPGSPWEAGPLAALRGGKDSRPPRISSRLGRSRIPGRSLGFRYSDGVSSGGATGSLASAAGTGGPHDTGDGVISSIGAFGPTRFDCPCRYLGHPDIAEGRPTGCVHRHGTERAPVGTERLSREWGAPRPVDGCRGRLQRGRRPPRELRLDAGAWVCAGEVRGPRDVVPHGRASLRLPPGRSVQMEGCGPGDDSACRTSGSFAPVDAPDGTKPTAAGYGTTAIRRDSATVPRREPNEQGERWLIST
jgi:hypothetical protein